MSKTLLFISCVLVTSVYFSGCSYYAFKSGCQNLHTRLNSPMGYGVKFTSEDLLNDARECANFINNEMTK